MAWKGSYHLRPAAEGQVTQSEFYKYFDTWKSETTSPLSELVFEEVEKFWADLTSWNLFFIKTGAPKNRGHENQRHYTSGLVN
jgi:hypothetical protein